MKKHAVAAASFVILVGSAGAAAAHHTTAQYDGQHPVELKAVVKEFEPANPHMLLTVISGGKTLVIEGQSVNNLFRMGYRRGMINVGDNITINFSPLKPGMEGYAGLFRTVTLADGRVIGTRGPGGGGGGAAGAAAAPAKAAPAK